MNNKNESSTSGAAAALPARDLSGLVLKCGGHNSPDDGLCVMEAVAWFRGEEHSAWPKCASWVIGASLQVLNDTMTNDERQQLVPLVPLIAGTGQAWDAEVKRAFVLVDVFVRRTLPMLWEGLGLKDEAAALGKFEIINSESSAARSADELSLIFENSKSLSDLRALSDLRDLSALRDLSDLRALRALSDLSALRALSDLRDLSALRALCALRDLRDLRALDEFWATLNNPEKLEALRVKMRDIALEAIKAALEIR